MSIFNIKHQSKKSSARSGILKTQHGKIETPFFMPIATYGAVKTQSSNEIKELPSNILLSNTYHLYIRPGTEILEQAGGLHKFMNWNQIIQILNQSLIHPIIQTHRFLALPQHIVLVANELY